MASARTSRLLRPLRAPRGLRWARALSSKPDQSSAVTPDFTTSVNVADIRLGRPSRKPKKQRPVGGSWEGLQGLEERTKGSLISETLSTMESDSEFQLTAQRLKEVGAEKMSLEERKNRRRALDNLGIPDFFEFLEKEKVARDLVRRPAEVLQLNIGLYCNQACAHCHVDSSPKRQEMMDRATADRCLQILKSSETIHTLDITGGAPELNTEFRHLVTEARKLPNVKEIIDRCNLTVLVEPGQEDLAEFLAEHQVRVVASLPCYSAKNVNLQRGKGVFDRSIQGLRTLNSLGYGQEGSGLFLDLVYNPLGGFLPPPQDQLEAKYKEELKEAFGITFNGLFTITNMPIKRFADFLHRRGELQEYMELLVRNFNPGTVHGLMCNNTISVGWDGKVFDCDFNQQLGLGAGTYVPEEAKEGLYAKDGNKGLTIYDFEQAEDLVQTEIVVDSHCFGCTAGMGSS
mmetsp:Transcript_12724/g.24334  ORF Transcript_12724/g.24334 Transcript_12724/m.24334 type:complete len:459 (-) Transcript_12724:1180-2556(-)